MSHSSVPVNIVVQSSESVPAPLEAEEKLEVHSLEAHPMLMTGPANLDSSVRYITTVTAEVDADGSMKEEGLKDSLGETSINPQDDGADEQVNESARVVEEDAKQDEGA